MKKLLALLCVFVAGTAAQAVTFAFPAGNSLEHTAFFDGTVDQANAAHAGLFTAGDYVQDQLFLTQPITFSSYSFTAPIINYSLAATENFDILLNNALIGSFSVTAQDAAARSISGAASFAPVTLSGLAVLRVRLTGTVPSGKGAIGAGTTGSFTLAGGVPEPGTWATMMLGLALTGWALRRPRRPLYAA